jgi:hypothetical protein
MEYKCSGPNTHVVTLMGRHWPAWAATDVSLIVDLRLYEPTAADHRALNSEHLRKLGFEEATIAGAEQSTPPGFILLFHAPGPNPAIQAS